MIFAIRNTRRKRMALSKSKDYAGIGEKAVKKFDTSIWLTLFLFLSYFATRITGFYAPAFAHPPTARLWGILALALLLLCVLQQVILRRSVWTLCNVFFLSSILSYVMASTSRASVHIRTDSGIPPVT